MTNPILSNAVENKGVILWQYDHAYNLIALIDGFNKIATATVTQFWDYFRDGVFNIMTADEFGLNVLGRIMGLPRPTVALADGSDSDSAEDVVPISDDFYRRLLLGRFFLFGMSPTVPNYNKYLNIVYGRFSADILPIVYTSDELKAAAASKASEGDSSEEGDDGTRTITEIAHLAFVETPASDGDSSDSDDDTPATLAVYDGRNNTLLFTMVEDASAPGKFVYAASNPAKGFSITFGGEPPTIGTFPATVNKAKVEDGLDMEMSFVPLSPDGQAALDHLAPEERAMHEQHPDLIYYYPAGIRTNDADKSATNVIGTVGQPLENFADAFSWVQKPTTAGGIFAGNEKAKYLDGITEEGN